MTGNADDMPDPAVEAPVPPAEVVIVGRFNEQDGYSVHRSAGARNWLLTATLHGHGRFRHGGVSVSAGAGDLVLLGPAVLQSYAAVGSWSFWWAHFQLRTALRAKLQAHQVGPALYVLRDLPAHVRSRIAETFRQVHADARWSGHEPAPATEPATPATTAVPASRDLAVNGIESVLLLALAAAGDPADPIDPRVRLAQSRMLADPAGPHTVATLAAGVALSPSRFAHLFAAHTGESPMQALHGARLEHAARLLEATDLDVGRIARASGFASPFHFSRAFKARYGVPPSAYQRTVAKNAAMSSAN